MKKHIRRGDLWLIGSLLALCALLFVILLLRRTPGAEVIVRVDGQEVARYSLSEDGEYPLNGGTNILVIAHGKAYLSDADCPDKLCVKQGSIQYTGQCITCLPNRLTVTVTGSDSGVDLYS